MKTKIAYSPFLCVVLVYTQLVLNKPIACSLLAYRVYPGPSMVSDNSISGETVIYEAFVLMGEIW